MRLFYPYLSDGKNVIMGKVKEKFLSIEDD